MSCPHFLSLLGPCALCPKPDKYTVIYADPPWSYADNSCNGGVGKEYSTMDFESIARLPIADIAAKDAVLFLWGTYPKLPEVLALIPRWGFEFKSIAFQWIKTRGTNTDGSGKPFVGLGRWTRGNTEPCFLAVRGKPHRLSLDGKAINGSFGVRQLLVDNELLIAPVGKHSAKPPETRNRIVTLIGDVPRIELFARKRAVGWHAWGNEISSDIYL